ncbi:GMC family oxidoreductase [Acetobacteraceae bacterium]|nr:GMC family oxidoreductase [Acetobacteraceae bacterium]
MTEISASNSTLKADVVIVGAGWVGAIMAKELTEAGLSVIVLERGPKRNTALEGAYPASIDELRGNFRHHLFQDLSKSTFTIRNHLSQQALPYRRAGAFLLGTGVGGAGLHWAGCHFRVIPEELHLKTYLEERYGKQAYRNGLIPPDMILQNFGVSYTDLEPFFTKAEKVFGTSGEAYTVKGKIVGKGNIFAPDRSENFPLPALRETYSGALFREGCQKAGFHPYTIPAANASKAYKNPYKCDMGACNFCGYCGGYNCYNYSKASPNVNIFPALYPSPLFHLIELAHVLHIDKSKDKKRATGVTFANLKTGKTQKVKAEIVILGAFSMNNVHLLQLSKIGEIYNPKTGKGTVGKNFHYQSLSTSRIFLDKETQINQFVGAGGSGVAIDDFTLPHLDTQKLGFIGGSALWVNQSGLRPIGAAVNHKPQAKRNWGHGFKESLKDMYQHSFEIDSHGNSLSYRNNCLDLDPTWKNAYGQPLLRMTFDWHSNDIKMNRYVTGKIPQIANQLNARKWKLNHLSAPFNTSDYKTTHLGGGAVMGDNPNISAVNPYLQSWELHNLFVIGASAFPHSITYNPTGLVAALAYWSAKAIKETYLKKPDPLCRD